jgi:hypothetical protein
MPKDIDILSIVFKVLRHGMNRICSASFPKESAGASVRAMTLFPKVT